MQERFLSLSTVEVKKIASKILIAYLKVLL